MAERVLKYLTAPHQRVDFSEDGRKHFMAYSACFSSEQGVLREQDDPGAPQIGIAPWHLAVLSAAQLVFDLAIDQGQGADLALERMPDRIPPKKVS